MSGRPPERLVPGYDLADVKEAFRQGRFRATARVMSYLCSKGWTRCTMQSCVASLTPSDFFKSQQHINRADAWLDIYRPFRAGERLYVKLTLLESGAEYLILSFCRDGEQH
ncbi:MAG: type II toxin-antitoxin system MqsR family toxin [Actinobacteria bacterium]|nr:type II toxin-antitoxin system MqsR family toxin [Actinomycetota bacterium]MCG2808693.1 type II toxin-antitoxin system MqsR family toxin [Coriobacteriia bacterium]